MQFPSPQVLWHQYCVGWGNNTASSFFLKSKLLLCLFLFHFNMFLMWWLLFPPHNLSVSSSTITYAINLLYTRISSCWSTYYSVITLTFSTLHFPRHLPSSIIHSFPFSSASSLVWLRCACRTVYPLSSTSSGMERKSGRGEFSKSLKNNIIFQF